MEAEETKRRGAPMALSAGGLVVAVVEGLIGDDLIEDDLLQKHGLRQDLHPVFRTRALLL